MTYLLGSWQLSPSQATTNPAAITQAQEQPTTSANQGSLLYRAGRFAEAAEVFEQAASKYQAAGNSLQQAMALSNFALAAQELGLFSEAETALQQSLDLLATDNSLDSRKVTAQTLNIQGGVQLAQGQVEAALGTWERATALYRQIGDVDGQIRSQINQAQALQAMGFYRRALKLLGKVEEDLAEQPDSGTKAAGLRSLGDVYQLIGNLEQADIILQQSLQVAETIESPSAISDALFSLANTVRSQEGKQEEALRLYQRASNETTSPLAQVQGQLNQLSLLSDAKNPSAVKALVSQIQPQLDRLPASRDTVYARINFARSLTRDEELGTNSYRSLIVDQLVRAVQEAKDLGDLRAQAYAVGSLGQLYEQQGRWQDAQGLTEQAIELAQRSNAPDLNYRFSWQLGRLLQQQGDNEAAGAKSSADAIAAYETAINILKSLRSDLVAINPDVQFSFRQSVEPVYREFVSLLLKDESGLKQASNKTSGEKLERARKVIESLQLAELDNFFRSACLSTTPVQIEELDSTAAVIYPIILPDRLEVILSIPDQPLRHYAANANQEEVANIAKRLQRNIILPTNNKDYLEFAQTIYDWLIRPAEADLARNQVQTLVFVLDSDLRNLPMATLYDGEQFLIEKYAVSVTPGLELLEARPFAQSQLQVLMAGLSEARQGFPELPSVPVELEQIQSQAEGQILLNQEFTENNIKTAIDAVPFPVVHLATHGRFSSKAEDTFILTWDGKISVNELDNLLKTANVGRSRPLELLVLSACETAKGDDRAALGIAGIAMRAGARSTIASLWEVGDEATTNLMTKFYEELAKKEVTKAEALRRAQVAMLKDPESSEHPYFWAAFILVGNWL